MTDFRPYYNKRLRSYFVQQYPLDLNSAQMPSLASLIVTAANADILTILQAQVWISPHLWLTGACGSGISHLGHVFSETHKGIYLNAEATKTTSPESLATLDVVIDDTDKADEAFLFHIINLSLVNNKRLLLLSHAHPRDLSLKLPDLGSRLKSMRVLENPIPDDALMLALLKRYFAQSFIRPTQDCLDYLLRRIERSAHAAQTLVSDLEHYANGRAFNRALARDFIDKRKNLSWLSDGYD
jgi:chromosomal replication initiation ATPase DnaA